MLWNHFLHGLAGIVLPALFVWTSRGVIIALAVALIAQGIDTVRLYFAHKEMALGPHMGEPAAARRLFHYKLAQLFLVKVFWYGFVTLMAASAMRGWDF